MKKTYKNLSLKKTTNKFRPYGVEVKLKCLGKANLKLTSESGKTIRNHIFVVQNAKESLLGLKAAERLGIVRISPEGQFDTEEIKTITKEIKDGAHGKHNIE